MRVHVSVFDLIVYTFAAHSASYTLSHREIYTSTCMKLASVLANSQILALQTEFTYSL